MAVLKGFALALLSVLLFMAVLVFGVAFTVNSTALNPRFIAAQVDRLDISALAQEELAPTAEMTVSPELAAAIATAASRLEADLKTQVNAATRGVYDYLLGRADNIDLSAVLKRTVLSDSFVSAVVNQPAIIALAEQYIVDELTADMPPQDRQTITPYLEEAVPALDPWIKQQMQSAAGQVVDYLLGQAGNLNVVVSLGSMKTTLRTSLHDAFVASPPPQLAEASSAQIEAEFNRYWTQYSPEIPQTLVVDSASLGLDTPASVRQGLADAEDGLAEARRVIGYFRLGYILLIVFMVLLVGGLIAIHHRVKGAALNLGVIFLVCGVLQYVGAVIGNHYARAAIDSAGADLPGAVRSWLPAVQTATLRPLEVFSLVLAGVGLVLIVVAIVYRPRHALP